MVRNQKTKTMTNLRDITTRGQFEDYYRQKGLATGRERIDHLMAAMKVKAIQCEGAHDEGRVLAFLEGAALVGSWKGYL